MSAHKGSHSCKPGHPRVGVVLFVCAGLFSCGFMGSDGPTNLAEAKKRMEARVDSWCACYMKAQENEQERAKETTLCMNLLPGGKFEMKMSASAKLDPDEAKELRSHAIKYRRKVEAECRGAE